MVALDCPHVKSSVHRTNVHYEFNAGLRGGYARRYANLGCENVNRHTNRNQYKRKGWCGLDTAIMRCDLTMVGKNIESIGCSSVRQRLEVDQPEILLRLQRSVRECRSLADLWSSVNAPGLKKGFTQRLTVPQSEWKELLGQKVQEYMVQFARDEETADFDDAGEILRWLKMRQRKGNWSLTFEELVSCRAHLYTKMGIRVSLEALRLRFADLGHDVEMSSQNSGEIFEILGES